MHTAKGDSATRTLILLSHGQGNPCYFPLFYLPYLHRLFIFKPPSQVTRDVLSKDKENRLRIAKYAKDGICLDNVLQRVAEMYEIPVELIKRRSRGGLASEARKSFIYASHKIFGFPVIEIARYLGISGPAASISLIGGEELMKKKEDVSLFLNLRP